MKTKKFKSFVFFALSLFFHKVILLYLPLYFLIKIFQNQKLLIYVFSFIGGLCFYLILITVLSEFYSVNFYISYQDQAAFQEKRSGILKVILVSLSILVTTIIFKTCEEYRSEKVKLLLKFRMTLFFYVLTFALVGFYEIWGRIIFVFYFIDLLLISYLAFQNTTQKYRFSYALIILSYAIAPNAKNILSG